MALYTPEEALNKARCFGTIEGKIDSLIESKDGRFYGYKVGELIKAQSGASWERYWTIWTDNKTFTEGQTIIVSGDVSFKYEEYTGADGQFRAKVIPHINNAEIKAAFTTPAPAATATESVPF